MFLNPPGPLNSKTSSSTMAQPGSSSMSSRCKEVTCPTELQSCIKRAEVKAGARREGTHSGKSLLGSSCLEPQCWGGRRQRKVDPWVCWPAHLDLSSELQDRRNLVSKEVDHIPEDDTWGWLPHAHAFTPSPIYVHTHTRLRLKEKYIAARNIFS